LLVQYGFCVPYNDPHNPYKLAFDGEDLLHALYQLDVDLMELDVDNNNIDNDNDKSKTVRLRPVRQIFSRPSVQESLKRRFQQEEMTRRCSRPHQDLALFSMELVPSDDNNDDNHDNPVQSQSSTTTNKDVVDTKISQQQSHHRIDIRPSQRLQTMLEVFQKMASQLGYNNDNESNSTSTNENDDSGIDNDAVDCIPKKLLQRLLRERLREVQHNRQKLLRMITLRRAMQTMEATTTATTTTTTTTKDDDEEEEENAPPEYDDPWHNPVLTLLRAEEEAISKALFVNQ